MHKQCVPDSSFSTHAREPGNEASGYHELCTPQSLTMPIYIYICIASMRLRMCIPIYIINGVIQEVDTAQDEAAS